MTDHAGDALALLTGTPASALVALDFDGTLAPLVADPARSRPAEGVLEVLHALSARVGTLAVVTGRPAQVAVDLGGFSDVPGLLVLGHYGLERWESGRTESPEPLPGVAAVRTALPGLLAAAPDGVAVEDKEHSLVVHTRPAADPRGAFEALRDPLQALAREHGLVLEQGRYALELRPPGVDKGHALVALTAERGPGVVLYAGDDLGDLAAADTLDRLRAAGTPTLLVCSDADDATPEVLRARADLRVPGPDGLVRLLRSLVAAMGPAGG